MRSALLAIALAPVLAGCPALDVLEGKESPYKAAHEQRVALLIDPAPSEPLEADVVVEIAPILEPPVEAPVVLDEPPAEPNPEPPVLEFPPIVEPAPCFDEFRVVRCVDGVATDWWSGEHL